MVRAGVANDTDLLGYLLDEGFDVVVSEEVTATGICQTIEHWA